MERYLPVFLPIDLFRAIQNTAVLRHFVYRPNTFGRYDLVFVQLASAFKGWRPFWNKVLTVRVAEIFLGSLSEGA